jgi:hypothetical protein
MRKVWFICTILFAACSGGSTTASTNPDATDTVADTAQETVQDVADATTDADATTPALVLNLSAFCDPWAQWACDRAASCGCGAPKGGALSTADCLAKMQSVCQKDMDKVGQMVDQSQALGFDPAEVSKCLEWLDKTLPACMVAAKDAIPYTACRGMLVWTAKGSEACMSTEAPCADGTGCVSGKCGAAGLADGSPCQSHGECASRVCYPDTHVCISTHAVGEPCTTNAECPPLTQCLSSKCTAPSEAGATCGQDEDCGLMLACIEGKCAIPQTTCTAGESCGNGGKCLGPYYNACAPQKADGAPCTQDGECLSGLTCQEGKCQPLPGLGLPCANGTGCANGLACSQEKQTCEAMPSDGQPCAMGEMGPFVCGEGLACQADTFVCKPPPGKGEACANPSKCSQADVTGDGKGGDLACAFGPSGSFCVLKLAEGDKCENDACQDGLFCSYTLGKCAKVLATGEKCKDGNECGPQGSCVPDGVGTLRCAPMPKQGEGCLFDCSPGLYCDKGMTDPTCQKPLCQLFYNLD